MKNIKLICIDVDGTLYNDEKTIPEENIKAIQKAYEKGIQIAITTGRMFNYGKLYGSLLGIPTLTIASNGAFVKYGDKVLNHQSITPEDLPDLTSAVKNSGLFAHFNAWNTLICEGELGDGNGYVKANGLLPQGDRIDMIVTDDLEKTVKETEHILKAIVFSKGDHHALQNLRSHFRNHPTLQTVASSKDNLEILRRDVSKAVGIQKLIDHLGIQREEVMAIGDEENDLPMISFAGLGIAMGNATEAVKAAASFITATNNEAGVAKAIEKYCL